MEAFPTSMHSLFFSHENLNFHSPIKTVKSRPTPIVSIMGINEGVHGARLTKKNHHQQQIPTIMEPMKSRKPSSEPPLLKKIFKELDKAIIKFIDPPLHDSVNPTHILSDNSAPVEELIPTQCDVVHGSIPPCLDGAYIRNGPNPQFQPTGPHHSLDGDGMVHSVRIFDGQATLCSRYVKTNKYLIEHQLKSFIVPNVIGGMQEIGQFLARGALFLARVVSGHYDATKGIGVANTNLAFLGGRLYALCESDLPYEIKVRDDGDIITLGQDDFDGKLSMNMTAHPKIDPETKEAFSFRYWSTRPYLTYFRFDSNGNKQPDVPIFSMKTPSLTHDLAITKKYAILCDIQLGVDPMNMMRGGRLVDVDPTKIPRIGVLPRYAEDESGMKWFEVPGFNIFHAVNAWDETDEDGNDVVVLVAPNINSVEHFLEKPDQIHGSMEKVKVNFGTGIVSRETLSSDNLEFPVINPSYVAKKNKYVYAAFFEKRAIKSKMMTATGVVKLDIEEPEENADPRDHTVGRRVYGDDCYGGEPFFIAREPENPNSEEDDGYVVCFVHNESLGESRFLVMDAKSPTLEIVAAVKLPQRVPYGLHGMFVREKELGLM